MLDHDAIWNRTYKRESVTPAIGVYTVIVANKNNAAALGRLLLRIVDQSMDASVGVELTPAEMRALATVLQDQAGTLESLEAEAAKMQEVAMQERAA